jgi:cell fate regulator YaaT (PSP1 superfamily)
LGSIESAVELYDYLLSFGTAGDFGRFRTTTSFRVSRGEQVVVRSYRGLELARVLCEATAGHARFLPNTTLGKLLRRASSDDLGRAEQMRDRSQEVVEVARRITHDLDLPAEVLDAEMMLDGQQTIVHYLSPSEFDERELVSRLSRQFDSQVCLHSLALGEDEPEEHEDGGCGRPDCGRGAGGQCSTCSSGGCSSCGSGNDLKAYFAAMREKMNPSHRTPLA